MAPRSKHLIHLVELQLGVPPQLGEFVRFHPRLARYWHPDVLNVDYANVLQTLIRKSEDFDVVLLIAIGSIGWIDELRRGIELRRLFDNLVDVAATDLCVSVIVVVDEFLLGRPNIKNKDIPKEAFIPESVFYRIVPLRTDGDVSVDAFKDELITTVEGELRRIYERHIEDMGETDAAEIKGTSRAIKDLVRQIGIVAPKEYPVLILGESGTGKELVAREIHRRSRRREAPLHTVNCSTFAESMVESELFGHEKGAYTGAVSMRRGWFETASGGTLFLDEVGELTAATQAKLLRVVENRTITRVGSSVEIPVDCRIIAATNRDLHKLVGEGKFREDLYYRLETLTLILPPLNDRPQDIPILARYFLEIYNEENNSQIRFGKGALSSLKGMPWPGNVRDLRNAVIELAMFSTEDVITTEQVRERDELVRERRKPSLLGEFVPLEEVISAHIERVVIRTNGNISSAARILEISEKTIRRKLKASIRDSS